MSKVSERTPPGTLLEFLENTVIPFEGGECLIWPYSTNGTGYGRVTIKGKKYRVTRVVCEVEHGPPPTPEHEAAHLCGNGHLGCCNRKHLEWKTRKENQADKLIHGTSNRGQRNGRAKLTESKVLTIRASTKSEPQLAKEFGVSHGTIIMIKRRETWAWLGNP